ncbi:Carboxylic ester hydrolase [Mycena sanguinolenta]|uniref:Carboxylic ester hydrolase n=1 Tax=Mycena sanguinolenta TaxID=230812 RepID=A0A8H6XG95_9AGAR|nr:Carboxylic ester hydrolase [Mycena sanguinolenta]
MDSLRSTHWLSLPHLQATMEPKFIAFFAIIVASAHLVDAQFQQACAALASQLVIPNTTIASTSFVAAGTTLTFPGVDPSCGTPSQVVSSDLCRVVLTVATSDRSSTAMEAWLPSNWTGRFLSTGNGGIGGCIQYTDMDYGSSLGFATTGSNNGHSGQNGTAFLNNIEVVKDFAWRSLLTSAVVGKQITDDFYGRPHDKSYYLGCSTGGRQGWKMAQDFPDVFDGIVAGSPAFAWNSLMSWAGMFQSPHFIDAELLNQCDGLDGAVDGIIEDPALCNFQPGALICAPGQTSACLTSKQAETVSAVFAPLLADGILVFPGLEYGPGLVALIFEIYSATQFLFTDNWFRFAVFNDPAFNASVLTPDEILFALKSNPGDIQAFSGDLSQFRDRGAKILHYHGQQDQLISSANSNRYYDHVSQTMNLPHSSIDEFYRFFRISGMEHCGGGPGATFIGNVENAVASLDPNQNVLTAMVRWIEEGIAPDTITGTAFINQTKALGVDFQRAHCRYPFHNVFTGKGDVKDPTSWECVL